MSWIRLSDTSLLTVGGYTYTSDLRLESKHEPGSPHWYLIIRNISLVDDGQYECQVSTTPHMSTTISLQIKGEEMDLQEWVKHAKLGISIEVKHIVFAVSYFLSCVITGWMCCCCLPISLSPLKQLLHLDISV